MDKIWGESILGCIEAKLRTPCEVLYLFYRYINTLSQSTQHKEKESCSPFSSSTCRLPMSCLLLYLELSFNFFRLPKANKNTPFPYKIICNGV